jgi:hypothetical protein
LRAHLLVVPVEFWNMINQRGKYRISAKGNDLQSPQRGHCISGMFSRGIGEFPGSLGIIRRHSE